MKKWILFIATILSLCSTVARADALEDAGEAYKKGNYAQALELILPLATQGSADAQNKLGFLYNVGAGVTKDYQKAVKWYRLAAEQGYADAQSNLGWMYANGDGVTQDYVCAYMWFNLAASKGDENAKVSLVLIAKEMTPSQIAETQKMEREGEKNNCKNCE